MPLKIDGRYAVLRSPGAHLHLARDERTGGRVLLREVPLPPELDGGERDLLAERVLREARAAGRIRHPAAVPVIDAFLHEGDPWIATPPIDGRPLSEVVARSGPLPPQRVAALGLEVLGALEAAHTLGVVHGDVQPSNVWLTPDGRGALTGFGTGVSVRSRSASSVGTPGFTAPEKTVNPAPASDLWSLGATLYHAVEGVPPFSGDSPMEVLSAVLAEEPRPPERAGGRLGSVLLSLLAKDPARRPAAVGEKLERLAFPAPAEGRMVRVRPGAFALLTASFAVAVASVTAIATTLLTSPEAPVSFEEPPGAADAGRFTATPRACDLLTDEQAEKLMPDFQRQEGSGSSGPPPAARCLLTGSPQKQTVDIGLSLHRPGPLGGGPETAREFLAGLRAEATTADPSDGRAYPVVDLPDVGDHAITYIERGTDSRYEARAVVVVSNLVASVECVQRDVRAGARNRVVKRLGSCAQRAARWVGESLKRAE